MATKAETRLSKSKQTRERLLDGAARAFREKGFESTSLKDLAKVTNISPSALYWHFESKSDLLYHVISRTLLRFEQGMRNALEPVEDNPSQAIIAVVSFYVNVQLHETSDVDAYTLVYASGHTKDHLTESQQQELRNIERRIFTLIKDEIDAGVADGTFHPQIPISTATFAIAGMCEQVQTWFRPTGESDVDTVAAHYCTLALLMLGAKETNVQLPAAVLQKLPRL